MEQAQHYNITDTDGKIHNLSYGGGWVGTGHWYLPFKHVQYGFIPREYNESKSEEKGS